MFAAINPFAHLSTLVSPVIMQTYVIVMIVLVAGGTLFDIIHKGSATYFFANWRKSKSKARQQVGGGELVSIAVQTAVVDVLASGEFCNARRRLAHLLTMYGFVIYLVTTAMMVFGYPTPGTPTPAMLPHAVVDRRADGLPRRLLVLVLHPRRCRRGRQLAVPRRCAPTCSSCRCSASVTLRPDLGSLQATGQLAPRHLLRLYIIATTVLFGGVPWSKFAHMFFKPAAAFEKRVSKANGTAENLPTQTRDDPEQQKRHSMELLRDAPMDMGLGIKREAPRHY